MIGVRFPPIADIQRWGRSGEERSSRFATDRTESRLSTNDDLADIPNWSQSSQMLRTASLALCVIMLSGCSYSYDITTSVSDGRVVFSANPQWGADCVRHIFVGEVTSEGIQDVGPMWDRSISYEDACENTFPIFYGESLRGRPHVYQSQVARTIGPKSLRIGVVYEVHATTGATGYGCGRFRRDFSGQVRSFSCY